MRKKKAFITSGVLNDYTRLNWPGQVRFGGAPFIYDDEDLVINLPVDLLPTGELFADLSGNSNHPLYVAMARILRHSETLPQLFGIEELRIMHEYGADKWTMLVVISGEAEDVAGVQGLGISGFIPSVYTPNETAGQNGVAVVGEATSADVLAGFIAGAVIDRLIMKLAA